jgi:nucleoside triphosphatase
MYMVFLICLCTVDDAEPIINDELEAFAWVTPCEMPSYDLNVATRATLAQVGILSVLDPSSRPA